MLDFGAVGDGQTGTPGWQATLKAAAGSLHRPAATEATVCAVCACWLLQLAAIPRLRLAWPCPPPLADCSVAFQKAIDAASAQNAKGVAVVIPEGEFHFKSKVDHLCV